MATKISPKSKSALATNSGRYTDLDKDKLRGGYYTSSEVANWLCRWAIRTLDDFVLEPSCGDGNFLEAASNRFIELGTQGSTIVRHLKGIEIIEEEADRARSRVQKLLGVHAVEVVETSDFFGWWQTQNSPRFDVVIGNPPFIRYQSFPEQHRVKAMSIMEQQGLTPNRLTNIWVPFVIAATASLRPGGRLAMVLPAELLQVGYAAQLRSFLSDRFARIDIVACNELFFEKAEQEVVLFLADGALEVPSEANSCRITMTEKATLGELINSTTQEVLANAQPKIIHHDKEKWLKLFLSEREIEFMRQLRASNQVASLSAHAHANVGVVTGKNEFFVLNEQQVRELGIEQYTTPLVSRSVQLKGACINTDEWSTLAAAGDRVHLLHLGNVSEAELPTSLVQYIRNGESKKIHQGYKCRIREPWYSVPAVWSPDGFVFRQIYDFPRIVLNNANATSTDTIHRLTSKGANSERIIANTYTWLTAASAEVEGRSYGGGVLELEPSEAERLLMPATLNGAVPLEECDRLTRTGRLNTVLEENARVVLMGHLGLSQTETYMLRDIWIKMRDRRLQRSKHERALSKENKKSE